MVKQLNYNNGKPIVAIYLLATIVSYLYVVILGQYNGDFISRDVKISYLELTIILVVTCLPPLYIYYLYKKNLKYEEKSVPIIYNLGLIRNIAWIVILLQMLIRISGYGTMGADATPLDTSSPLSVIREIIFKVPVLPWVIIYVLGTSYKRGVYYTIFLFCIFSIVQKSMGGIFTCGLLLLYKYPGILSYFKRHILISGLIIFFIPNIILFGYRFRDALRSGPGFNETTTVDLIGGKLCGRVSSFSNNAYIYENIITLFTLSDEIPQGFYYYDTLHYLGFRPEFKSTGNFVQREITHGKNENYSIMAGIGGVLLISAAKGLTVFIANLALILGAPCIIFSMTRKMGLRNASGIALLLCIWFTVNGDSSEIANNIYYLLFIGVILNFCKIKRHEKY